MTTMTIRTTTAPADLDAYWDAIDAELAAIPAAPEAEPLPLHSTDFSTTYRVKLTSIGPYRIEVFLSIPDGEGPFPAIMLPPGYGSVVTPPSYDDRMRYVAMSIRYRGTRGADKPYAAKFPGLLTDGIDDPATWIFRGIFADTLRAFEYLSRLPIVDTARIAINGSDAGRDRGRAAAGGDGALGDRALLLPAGRALSPHRGLPGGGNQRSPAGISGQREAVDRTLAYFDPLHHAPG